MGFNIGISQLLHTCKSAKSFLLSLRQIVKQKKQINRQTNDPNERETRGLQKKKKKSYHTFENNAVATLRPFIKQRWNNGNSIRGCNNTHSCKGIAKYHYLVKGDGLRLN